MKAYDIATRGLESKEEYDILLEEVRNSAEHDIKGLVERMSEEVKKDHWLNRKLYINSYNDNLFQRNVDAQELLARVLFDNAYVKDEERLYIDVKLEHLAYHLSQNKSSSGNTPLDNWIQAQRNYVRLGLTDIMNRLFVKDFN